MRNRRSLSSNSCGRGEATGAGYNCKQPAARTFYKVFITRGEWIDSGYLCLLFGAGSSNRGTEYYFISSLVSYRSHALYLDKMFDLKLAIYTKSQTFRHVFFIPSLSSAALPSVIAAIRRRISGASAPGTQAGNSQFRSRYG